MNRNRKSPLGFKRGYTLIELMLVVTIVSLLVSIMTPRFDLVLQNAYQAAAKSNLGSIRTSISVYYSEMEGQYPLAGVPNGFPDSLGLSLSQTLCPKYMAKLPTIRLLDRAGNVNGTGILYDVTTKSYMEQSTPVKDVVIETGTNSPSLGVFRPMGYDPDSGALFIYNDNYDVRGIPFNEW